MSNYEHPVLVTVPATMNDRGQIRIEKRFMDVDLSQINDDPPNEWAEDGDTYILRTPFSPEPVSTTVGVIREILRRKGGRA